MADQAAPLGRAGRAEALSATCSTCCCDPATLLVAWERVKRNRGSKTAGVDGQTRWHVEQMGVERVLGELRQSLKDGSYAPLPVREHEIPKRGSGKVRRLGIPALRDRIVQMATTLVLEPIWEADFSRAPMGFGPTVERRTPSSRCGSSSTRHAPMSGR